MQDVPRPQQECQSCRFWQTFGKQLDPLEDTDEPWGYYRRYPPKIVDVNDLFDSGSYRFPITLERDWCGEWNARPARPEDRTATAEVRIKKTFSEAVKALDSRARRILTRTMGVDSFDKLYLLRKDDLLIQRYCGTATARSIESLVIEAFGELPTHWEDQTDEYWTHAAWKPGGVWIGKGYHPTT